MGSLIIFIAGILGACQVNKRTFLQSWCSLINLCFAVYFAVFLTPFLVTMLEIKGLDTSYKICISLIALLIVVCILLFKLVGLLFPETDIKVKIPVAAEKCGTMICSFFSFMIIVAFVLFCFTTIPYSKKLPLPESIRTASAKTLRGVVNTVNGFSFQTLSETGVNALQTVGLIEVKKENPEEQLSAKNEEKEPSAKKAEVSSEVKKSAAPRTGDAVEQKAVKVTEKLPVSKSADSSTEEKLKEKTEGGSEQKN